MLRHRERPGSSRGGEQAPNRTPRSRRDRQELTPDGRWTDHLAVGPFIPTSAIPGVTMFGSEDPDTSTTDESAESGDPETFGQQTVWEEHGD